MNERAGRRAIIGIIAVGLTLHAVALAVGLARGSVPEPVTLLLATLPYLFLYRRANWARWILIAVNGVAGALLLAIALQALSIAGSSSYRFAEWLPPGSEWMPLWGGYALAMAVVNLALAGVLAFSPQVRAYLSQPSVGV